MKRDSIFYQLFQQSPSLLFDLLENPPDNATEYRFDSVAVKEPKFEIDGVFLPPDTDRNGVIYFCEVQFQKDERLYERVFGESFLYFYRQRERFTDWQIVVIYPTPSLEHRSDSRPENTEQCGGIHWDSGGVIIKQRIDQSGSKERHYATVCYLSGVARRISSRRGMLAHSAAPLASDR